MAGTWRSPALTRPFHNQEWKGRENLLRRRAARRAARSREQSRGLGGLSGDGAPEGPAPSCGLRGYSFAFSKIELWVQRLREGAERLREIKQERRGRAGEPAFPGRDGFSPDLDLLGQLALRQASLEPVSSDRVRDLGRDMPKASGVLWPYRHRIPTRRKPLSSVTCGQYSALLQHVRPWWSDCELGSSSGTSSCRRFSWESMSSRLLDIRKRRLAPR